MSGVSGLPRMPGADVATGTAAGPESEQWDWGMGSVTAGPGASVLHEGRWCHRSEMPLPGQGEAPAGPGLSV